MSPREGLLGAIQLGVLGLALLGCGGDDPKPAAAPAVTVPLTLPTTAEQILSDDPEPPVEEEPVATTESTPTTLATGLPSGLGIPGAGSISLGSGSSISNSFTVREVAFLEVVAFVQTALEAQGWLVQPTLSSEAGVGFGFTGPGAAGEATVVPQADGTVRVRVVLGG